MLFFLALCFLPACLSQVFVPSPCPEPSLQENFDLSQYVGKWYQASAYPFFFTGNGKCVTAEYTPLEDGTVQVNNTVFDFELGDFRSDLGSASVPDANNPAQLCVKFTEDQPCGDYQVLSTDYEYTLIYSCGGLGFSSIQVGWILSRTPNYDPAAVEALINYAESVGVSREYWEPTVQDCGN